MGQKEDAGKVVRLSRTRRGLTVGDLVSAADAVPSDQLLGCLQLSLGCLAAASLALPLAADELRDLIIIGALINRLLFTEIGIPRDPSYRP